MPEQTGKRAELRREWREGWSEQTSFVEGTQRTSLPRRNRRLIHFRSWKKFVEVNSDQDDEPEEVTEA